MRFRLIDGSFKLLLMLVDFIWFLIDFCYCFCFVCLFCVGGFACCVLLIFDGFWVCYAWQILLCCLFGFYLVCFVSLMILCLIYWCFLLFGVVWWVWLVCEFLWLFWYVLLLLFLLMRLFWVCLLDCLILFVDFNVSVLMVFMVI